MMKATKLEVGKTYRLGERTYVFEQVMGPFKNGAWEAMMDGEGYRFWPENMPDEVGPPFPWIIRPEYRVPQEGEWFVTNGGTGIARHEGRVPLEERVVLIIERNLDFP